MTHEPRIVFVAWQCPEPQNHAFYPVARLLQRAGSPRYEFAYVQGVHDAIKVGFRPFFGSNLNAVLGSEQLPAFLATRLMSPQRPDYATHVESLGLSTGAEPITILGRSEGAKVTDNLEVLSHPGFDPLACLWVYHGFCRGIRHLNTENAVSVLRPGDQLIVEPEPANQFDPDALLLLRVDSQVLGYIPRTLIDDLRDAARGGRSLQATVERVNAPPVPVQQRLSVRLAVPAMDGFRPFSTIRYQPVSPAATAFSSEDLMQRC